MSIDVFISYAHLDDRPRDEGLNGWVTDLHDKLVWWLGPRLGREPTIWRDPRLERHGPFGDALIERIRQSTAFISVVSPASVRSEWCLRELSTFVESKAPAGGVPKTLFRVVKTPVPRDEEPAVLREVLGHEFFAVHPQTNHLKEFRLDLDPDSKVLYMERLGDLVHGLAGVLDPDGANGVGVPTTGGATVFLADTTSGLENASLQLRRVLGQRGHTVLPDQPLPHDRPSLEARVQGYLERCDLSIHLVGREFALVPEGADRSALVPDAGGQSVVELQLVQAAACIRDPAACGRAPDRPLSALIWVPEGLQVDDPRQSAFITALRANLDKLGVEDLLETQLHELIEHVQDKLRPDRETFGAHVPILYLLCEPEDREHISELADYLFEREVEVELPLFDGDEEERLDDHLELLCMCDALLIYYGHAEEADFRKRLREVRQVRRRDGIACQPNWRATGIYVADPRVDYKASLRTRYVDEVITAFGGFSPEALDRFLGRLQPRQGGRV